MTHVKSVTPVKSVQEVVGLFELTDEQANKLRKLNRGNSGKWAKTESQGVFNENRRMIPYIRYIWDKSIRLLLHVLEFKRIAYMYLLRVGEYLSFHSLRSEVESVKCTYCVSSQWCVLHSVSDQGPSWPPGMPPLSCWLRIKNLDNGFCTFSNFTISLIIKVYLFEKSIISAYCIIHSIDI